jgi:hypothetical protein
MGCAADADPSQEVDESQKPQSTEAAQHVPTVEDGQVETQAKKHCHVLSKEDWWVVTGQVSEYGGTFCH